MMNAERLEVLPVLTSESVAATSKDMVEIIEDDLTMQNKETIVERNEKGE